MEKRKLFPQLVALTAVLLLTAGCAATSNNDSATSSNTDSSNTSTISTSEVTGQYKDEELETDWDESSATNITLKDSSITVDGSGATADGDILTITAAGTYVISGKLSDGQILVNASDNDTVRLILNGVDITSADSAPIYASSADKVIITLAEGMKNTVTDGGDNFDYTNTKDEEPDAAVFSKCDLTINGTGTLVVNAGFNNGIGTKDDLVIASGTFIIDAENHGIRGRDSVTILDGSFEITAGNDGVQSNNDEKTDKGWISLEGGTYNISTVHDGFQSENVMVISGGDYTIITGDESSSSNTSDSYKGIKAASDIVISGGTFKIDSADDSVHSNGSISISDGDFTLASGDDGVHADEDLNISGGTINITESYEGLEGATINISAGTIDIVASDDGINAAGGSDSRGEGNFGPDSFSSSSGEYYINISGGEVSLVAGGDGLDANGDITISGGKVISLIDSTPDNEAMDLDGTFTVTGGTIIYGGTGVGEIDDSTQSYIYLDSSVSTGTEVSVQSNGRTIISFTPKIDCQYLVFSSPDITSDKSYDVYSGSSLLASVTAGTGGSTGGMGGQGGPGGNQGGPGGKQGGGPGDQKEEGPGDQQGGTENQQGEQDNSGQL